MITCLYWMDNILKNEKYLHVWQHCTVISVQTTCNACVFLTKPHYTRPTRHVTPESKASRWMLHALAIFGVSASGVLWYVVHVAASTSAGIFPNWTTDKDLKSEKREILRFTKGWGKTSCMDTPTSIHWLLLGDTLHGTLYLARSSRLLYGRCWFISIV